MNNICAGVVSPRASTGKSTFRRIALYNNTWEIDTDTPAPPPATTKASVPAKQQNHRSAEKHKANPPPLNPTPHALPALTLPPLPHLPSSPQPTTQLSLRKGLPPDCCSCWCKRWYAGPALLPSSWTRSLLWLPKYAHLTNPTEVSLRVKADGGGGRVCGY